MKRKPEITPLEKALYSYPAGRFKIALLFPNSYEAAMGSLGFQTVYRSLNSIPDFTAQRYYSLSREEKPSPGFPILALSIAYELDLINFIRSLIDWNIEPLAANRAGPLTIAGGVLTLINPLPLAPFADIVMLGDGELLIPRFAKIYAENYLGGKAAVLQAASQQNGFWVPSMCRPPEFKPLLEPRRSPLHSVILSSSAHFGSMFLIEIGRGCPRRCRFCASSYIHNYEYHPLGKLMEVVEGNVPPPTTIGLIGSALSDYPDLIKLLRKLVSKGYKLGISSLRPDVLTQELAGLLAEGGVRTLTIAPEAGSLRMRKLIGKGIFDELIYDSIRFAAEAKIPRLKLYFLIGLPGECEDDIRAIVEMVNKISLIAPDVSLELSINAFIPKFHTPFAEAGMASESYLKKVRRYLRNELPGMKFSPRSAALETAQAIISQGDENVGLALLDSAQSGISLKNALKRRGIDWKTIVSSR
ncbi:MAG: radical SAM protein [candidate division Zixibacteria bacterium]|nr:radical SAM protein [Candidatus Tariuqbacter arcticus]